MENRNLQNEEVISMLKDFYFRITVVNLDKNLVENVKLREAEREMEFETVQYDETMKLCAKNFVRKDGMEILLRVVMIGKESDSTESLWLYSKVEKID